MNIIISVTQEDIRQGAANACHTCPVAHAARRALGRLVTITGCCMWISSEDFPLPTAARVFIARFDAGLPVEPFTFAVDLPDEIAVSVAAHNLAEAKECLHLVQSAIEAGHLPVLREAAS